MNLLRNMSRISLGLFLVFAGTGHLTFARTTFTAQVPTWLPLDADFVVVASGVVEVLLGLALLPRWKGTELVGVVTALFFLAVFPGNVAQFLGHVNAFGLNTDLARGIRLLFQPLLVIWALWSTKGSGQKWWTISKRRPR